ncbi:hypothetical protein Agabi119p4_2752 [Agaricus bisporus var. burnettii]|uniref:NACHT domain-containing protein n=1 Tax=Agaricus bisporus var. burnettii TaxID=192524 RepID=A0A8H7F5R5_AGABI|nr:hypothetical protein Agabi119p4_2752 [Agaricus bisporus var. burnettii]
MPPPPLGSPFHNIQDTSNREHNNHLAQRTTSLYRLPESPPTMSFIDNTNFTSLGDRRSLGVSGYQDSDSVSRNPYHDNTQVISSAERLTPRMTSNSYTYDDPPATSHSPMPDYSDPQSSRNPSLFQTLRLPMPKPTNPEVATRYTDTWSTTASVGPSTAPRGFDSVLQSTERRSEWDMSSPPVSSQPLHNENLVHRTNVTLPAISKIVPFETTCGNDKTHFDQANTHLGRSNLKRMLAPESLVSSKRQRKIEENIPLSNESRTSKGFLHAAHDFVLQNPTMIDVGQVTHVQNDRPDETLRWLKEYTMHGTEFDSSERDPPPRCHPNTRESIIRRAKDWIDSPRREKKQLWVRGAAGVGKSAVVQTLAESLAEEKRLGGSVFISRPNGRNNPKQIFPSIAYQLAVRDANYRAYITSVMLEDPRSLEKSMKEQLRILIIEPFVEKRLRSGLNDLVIALDGLDECDGDPAQDDPRFRKRTSDNVQCEIVQLISGFVLRYPCAPLIWIISSRPEKHLQTVFYDEAVQSSFWEEDIPVDSDEACQDVERFLVSEFERIQKRYPDHMPHAGGWPSREDFSKITKAALGLFIFAEVVIRFVDDPYVKNPIAQLKTVLATISQLNPSTDINPLAVLDAIYIEILKRVPSKVIGPAREIIAYMIDLDRRKVAKSKFNVALICNALIISKDVAVTALHHLHSVLNFSGIKDIGMTRPRFYHASFCDFLLDPSRSHEFSVQNIRSFFSDGGCLGLALSEHLRAEGQSLPWPGEHSFTKRVINGIPHNEAAVDVGPVTMPSSFPFFSPLLSSHNFAAVVSGLSIDGHDLLNDEETVL